MAITAVDPVTPQPYVTNADKDDPNPTRFLLRGLTSREKINLLTRIDIDPATGNAKMNGSILDDILAAALTGWENFKDGAGHEVAYDRKNRSANLDRLPPEVLNELAMEIMRRSGIVEDDKKN